VKTETKAKVTMKTVVILILAMAGSLFLPACKPAKEAVIPVGNWDGSAYETVRIRVIDDKDGEPVSGARVWLMTGEAYSAYQAYQSYPKFIEINGSVESLGKRVFTDTNGKAAIDTPFGVGGGIMSDGTHARNYRGINGIVIVEGSKYARFESELKALLPSSVTSSVDAPISIAIRLKEKADKQQ